MLSAHGVTHAGRRPTNEDAFLASDRLGLFVVADGMGGHNAGEVASGIAVRTIQQVVESAATEEGDVLGEAVRVANREVLLAAGRDLECSGMGTTVVAVLVTGDRLHCAGVGDSRAYLLHEATLLQLTRDDTWVAHVVASGGDPGRDHPMRHVLTKVVGLRSDIEVTVTSAPFAPGDVLLLCSDGLHGTVGDARIAATLGAGLSSSAAAVELLTVALESGATDNVTAIIVQHLA